MSNETPQRDEQSGEMCASPQSSDPLLPGRIAAIEARMWADAQNAVLCSGQLKTVQDVAKLAGIGVADARRLLDQWLTERLVFAIHHNGVEYFPCYAFDPKCEYAPYPVLREVLSVFGERKGGWGIALWFECLNSYLGGVAPRTLIGETPERVLLAAKDEVAPLLHG